MQKTQQTVGNLAERVQRIEDRDNDRELSQPAELLKIAPEVGEAQQRWNDGMGSPTTAARGAQQVYEKK